MLIEKVLEPPVVGVDSATELAHPLSEAERQAIISAVPSRQAEFETVRACAAAALKLIGVPSVEIVPDAHRAPVWPAGVVGSLSHCEGFRAAAVARKGQIRSVGIDVEPNLPISESTTSLLVLSAGEMSLCRSLGQAAPAVSWDRLIFSAKESLFKAWWPLTTSWLGFDDAEVEPRLDGSFIARIAAPRADISRFGMSRISGRWASEQGFLMTSVVVVVAGADSMGDGHRGMETLSQSALKG